MSWNVHKRRKPKAHGAISEKAGLQTLEQKTEQESEECLVKEGFGMSSFLKTGDKGAPSHTHQHGPRHKNE